MLLVQDSIDEMLRDLSSIGQEVDDSDFFWGLNKTVDYLRQTYDLPNTKLIQDLTIYGGVSEYALNSDFVTLIPPRNPNVLDTSDIFTSRKEKEIYTDPNINDLAVEFDRETPYLRLINDLTDITVDSCQDITNITISGDSSAVLLDKSFYTNGSASVGFTITASGGSTTITFPLQSQVDITDFLSYGRAFIDLFIPRTNTEDLTSIVMRIGNDASNYYEMTATTKQRGSTLNGGYGVIGFNLQSVTETGSVADDEVDWCQIIINHGTTGVNGLYRIGRIFLGLGKYLELPYYSSSVIKDSTGSYKAKISDANDHVLIPLGSEGVLKYKTLEYIAVERLKDQTLGQYFARELEPFEQNIKSTYPKQGMVRQTFWYKR